MSDTHSLTPTRPEDIALSIFCLNLGGSCMFLAVCNRKKFFVILLPLNYDPNIHEDPTLHQMQNSPERGAGIPPLITLLPGYNSVNPVKIVYLEEIWGQMGHGPAPRRWGDMDSVQDSILQIGGQTIRDLAKANTPWTLPPTLQYITSPDVPILQMITIDGKAQLVLRDDIDSESLMVDLFTIVDTLLDLPLVPVSDVIILRQTSRESFIVRVGAEVQFCKVALRSNWRLCHEIEQLQRVESSRQKPLSVCIPYLKGLITMDDDTGLAIGFLTNYIEKDIDLEEAAYMGFKGNPLPVDKISNWLGQVEEGVKQLHSAGIVWGDVYPANVLIDNKGIIWLINFAGGYFTLETSTENLRGSVQGDLDSLVRLRRAFGPDPVFMLRAYD